MYQAVFFDIGGVCVHSPLEGIRTFEKAKGLPENYLNVAIEACGETGAFQRLERGELSLPQFYPKFGEELSDPKHGRSYDKYLRAKGKPTVGRSPPLVIDGKELFTCMMEAASRPNEMVLTAVKKLRASGKFKVAALTNNFQFEDASSDSLQLGKVPPEIVELFDEYIESSLVGLRKPDPRFFEFACKKMNVTPDQAIMIDDIGPNLKAAKQLGMTTIRVVVGKAEEAIEQLEQLVQMPLRDRIEPPPRPGPPPLRGSTVLAFTTDIEGCTVYPPPSTADPATLSAAALTALSIEIPDFEIVDTRQIARVIRDTFPISSSPDPTSSATLIEQLSDETYVTRHRKHEYLEKRLRNREKEYVKHQLYTQRVVGSGGGGDGVFAAATHPRKRIGETVPVVRRSAVVLKSTYILASRSVNGQGDGADGVDEERVVVGSEEGKGRIGKRKRAPMPFGYPMGAMPSKAFERSGPLLELLKELGKA